MFSGTYSKIDEAIEKLANAQITAQEEGGLPFDLATKLEKALSLCEEIIGEIGSKALAEPNNKYK
jgi:hypothetical protein